MKDLYAYSIPLALAIVAVFTVSPAAMDSSGLEENVYEDINVCAYKNGEPVTCTHNVLMEGEEAIEDQVKSGQAISWDTIAVGNGTAPTDSSGTLDSEITDCGLSPQAGTFEDNGDGDWNLSVTYDVTCDDIDVNTTAQKSTGASSSIDYFAGADLGRTINLYSGDSLTIEWNNQVQ